MARLHSGGFINQDFYFNIGTEDARGRDGDTARDAAKKYNDHRHSPYAAVSKDALRNWINELVDVSTDPLSGNPGGLLEAKPELLRLSGDTAELNSVVYMMTNAGVRPVTSGFGPHISLPADPTVDAEIVADFICSNYLMLRRQPQSVNGFTCFSADDGSGDIIPIATTIGECVMYPTAEAGSGQVSTQVVTTAAVRVATAPPVSTPPTIGVSLQVKRFDYEPITRRILSNPSAASAGVVITSTTGAIIPEILNSNDRGLTVTTLMDLHQHFVGKLEVEMQFDVDGCYSPSGYLAEATAQNRSLAQLKSNISAWAQNNVTLEVLDITGRIVCTFGGE